MLAHPWIEKTILLGMVFGLPSLILIAFAFIRLIRRDGIQGTIPMPYWSAAAAVFIYAASVLNLYFHWSVMFMIGWPVLVVAICGVGLARSAAVVRSERWMLFGANGMLVILSLALMIAPN